MLIYFEKHNDCISKNFEFKNVRINEQDLKNTKFGSRGFRATSRGSNKTMRIDYYLVDTDIYDDFDKLYNWGHHTIDMFLKTYLRREKLKKINEQIRKEII